MQALNNVSQAKLAENTEEERRSANKISFEFRTIQNPAVLLDALEDFKKSHSASDLVSRSFITAMVSQFDVYIGNLVRSLYKVRPDVLQLSSKSITYSQIIECGDIEILESQLIDSEVESLLRQSHIEHFE